MSAVGIDPILWIGILWPELQKRQPEMLRFDRYYSGDHELPFLTRAHDAKMRDEFLGMIRDSKSNFCRLVVDAVEERLNVDGFRLSASSSSRSDRESWDTWQANGLDSESSVGILEALVKGVSYVSVWRGDDDERASIAIEDPTQTIVGYAPGTGFRRRAAALKVWMSATGHVRANVYTASGIYKFVSSKEGPIEPVSPAVTVSDAMDADTFETLPGGSIQSDALRREPAMDDHPRWVELEDEFLPNPLGVVPIIPLRNRPRLLAEGESELVDVVPVQKQINGFLFLLALAGYFGAHRQRWAVGVPIADGPDQKPTELFSAVDTLWQNENPAAKFGEFSPTDLAGYISAIEQKVLHIAVTTRTPRHYLIEQGQSPSGDAIKSAESGLVAKVERKMGPFGEAFEEALILARRLEKEEAAPVAVDSEIVWRDAELTSEGERTDAVSKKISLGLIDRWQGLEDLGYTQTQIERMRNEPAPIQNDDLEGFALTAQRLGLALQNGAVTPEQVEQLLAGALDRRPG